MVLSTTDSERQINITSKRWLPRYVKASKPVPALVFILMSQF
jgi:hypothetical protein